MKIYKDIKGIMSRPARTLIGIIASDDDDGIAKDGKIPWKFPVDNMFFKAMIKDQVVVVSQSTARQIKSLDCWAIIVSSQGSEAKEFVDQKVLVNYLGGLQMIKHVQEHMPDKKIYLCGGAKIYDLYYDLCSTFYVTHIPGKFGCDMKFEVNQDRDAIHFELPNVYTSDDVIFAMSQFQEVLPDLVQDDYMALHNRVEEKLKKMISERNPLEVEIRTINEWSEEANFLRIGLGCISNGKKVQTRNGPVRSIFAQSQTFDLRGGTRFPLLTSRKLFFRGIFEELMMYLRGQTNNQVLVDKGIQVWTPNTTREFLDQQGLQHLPVGDMGNSYGFAMRHFGAEYVNCLADYEGKGVDQLRNLIDGLKNDPNGRRHMITLWNPAAVRQCPLPPCLWSYQFYVDQGLLSCMATQRSSDYAVAGGWNIATIALFTMLLAKMLGMIPHRITWNVGDLHIYEDHVQGFKEQAQRELRDFPTLNIKTKKDITDYEFEDLELMGYNPHPNIPFKMLA